MLEGVKHESPWAQASEGRWLGPMEAMEGLGALGAQAMGAHTWLGRVYLLSQGTWQILAKCQGVGKARGPQSQAPKPEASQGRWWGPMEAL